jgi:hypothetical protein
MRTKCELHCRNRSKSIRRFVSSPKNEKYARFIAQIQFA